MDDDDKAMPFSEVNMSPLLDPNQCPRCGGGIPNNTTPGEYPGALSRWDNETEICSECGTQEAMIQFEKRGYRGDGNTLDDDHANWYILAIEAIIAAKSKEDAQGVLLRLLT